MSVNKVSYFVYENYFWIVFLDAIIGLTLGKHYLFSIVLPLVWYFLAYKTKKNKFCIADIFVALILISCIVSWLVNSYNYKYILIFRHIMGPLSYMSCYFIGKNYIKEFSYSFFDKALMPALLASLIGLYCFFFPPSWYYGLLIAGSETGEVSLEALRLHSIFSSPYVLAYMDGLLLIYIFFRVAKDTVPLKKYVVYILVFLITLMFCMMRAPIGGVILSFMVSLFYLAVYKNKLQFFIKILAGSFVAVLLLIAGLRISNSETFDFMVEKIEILMDKNDSFIEDRYNLVESEDSFLGDGAGRHNLFADDYVPGSSLRDGEYRKIQQEVGSFGMCIYIGLFAFIVLKSITYFKYLPFEFCVVIFLLFSMIGAAPLSTPDKHCFIFWLVLGYISSFGKNEIKRLNNKNRIYESK